MIVGFAGLAGSGKNEAARGLAYPSIAFADSLKEMILRLDPVLYESDGKVVRLKEVVDQFGWDKSKREVPEVRRLLQELGMATRELSPDIFVDNLSSFIELWLAEGNKDLCITDVRFPNELENVRWWGGKVIWIERPGVENLGGPTENSITAKDCDYIIINDGTVAQLHANVRDLTF